MARIALRINLHLYQVETLASASKALHLSKSEIVNRALLKATQNFPEACRFALERPANASTTHKPASFMIDPEVLQACQEVTDRLTVSRDTITRLALEQYLDPTNSNAPQSLQA